VPGRASDQPGSVPLKLYSARLMLEDRTVAVGGREATAQSARARVVMLPRPRAAIVAAALFVCVDLLYFGRGVIDHMGSTCLCTPGSDPSSYQWFLAWWPHALLHGDNPFVTDRLFAPGHVNLGAVDLVPGPALLAAPVTLLFGPVVSFNLLALLAPALAAGAAYALCRELGAGPPGAWLGGLVFGFSPYMLGHLLGHLDLIMVFPVPVAALIAVRRIEGRMGGRACALWMGLAFSVQLLCSLELGATLLGVGACALVLAAALLPARRRAIARALPSLGAGVALAAIVCSPWLAYGLTGPTSAGFFLGYGEHYSSDGLGPLVPTAAIRLGRHWFHTVSGTFSGNLAETESYLGIALVLILMRFLITRWCRAPVRLLTAMLVLVVVLMLGPHLQLAGQPTIPLPWDALQHLPVLDHIAPVRLSSDMFLLAGIILALWCSERRRRPVGALKWIAALAAVVLLVPNLGSALWRTPIASPRLFSDGAYRSVIPRNAIVLPLPLAQSSESMLWQAQADFRYRMADGYVGAYVPPGYAADLSRLLGPSGTPTAAGLRAYLADRHVRIVIVDDADPEGWPALLAADGLRASVHGGASVYAVPTASAG
jgi:hypothetical protein